jgi:VanZ family protein
VHGRKTLRILCGIAIIAVLIATLWPLNPFPPNRVTWLQGANGIKFGGAGLVVSNVVVRAEETEAKASCSLELLLRPASVESAYTILAFYVPKNPRQFVMRQYKDGLLVTRDVVSQSKLKTIKFDVDHAFQPGKLRFVTLASGLNGTTVYLDGHLAQVFPRFRISRAELSGLIVVGASAVDYQPWTGEVRGLAIYSKELTLTDALRHYRDWINPGVHPPDLDGAVARYVFAEAGGREIRNQVVSGSSLEIPRSFSVPHKVMLESAANEFKTEWRYLSDVLLNVTGFVPLGFVVCAYLACTRSRGTAILYAILVGGILSFMIEVLQFYVPRRVSGMTDIITNTLGAALGALLLQRSVVRRTLGRMKLMPMC